MLRLVPETVLFDLWLGIETAGVGPKSGWGKSSAAPQDAVPYYPTFTSVLRTAKRLVRHSFREYREAVFVDVGCGAGKALVYWHRYSDGARQAQVLGVDYDEDVLKLARENLRTVGASAQDVNLVEGTVPDVDFAPFIEGKNRIVWLYNPFGAARVQQFVSQLSRIRGKSLVFYVNPQNPEAFERPGIKPVLRVASWHPALSFACFEILDHFEISRVSN